MALFNGWPWAQFQEQNLDWIIKAQKALDTRVSVLESEEQEEISFIVARAELIGITENDTGSNNSLALQKFIDEGEENYLYFQDNKTYNFIDPIVLTRDIKFVGGGQLRYTGPVNDSGYFITTFNEGTTYNSIKPQSNSYTFNIDCRGLINGILFKQGIHNKITATVRNARNVGFNDSSTGNGYENYIFVSVINDTDSLYANSIGVLGKHPDNKYQAVFTRNCNTAFKAERQASIDYIHSWIVGDSIFPGSACLRISGSGVTCHEIYCDTMQHAIYLDSLPQRVKIGTVYAGFNDNAVSAATLASYPYRPWDGSFTPSASQTESVEIDTIYPLVAHGTTYNLLELKSLDKNITVLNAVDYRVKGNFRFIPSTEGVYAAGSDLTGLPQGVSGYFGIRACDEGQYYKVIDLLSDRQAEPIYKIWYNKTNGRSIFFTVAKTYLTTVQYAE